MRLSPAVSQTAWRAVLVTVTYVFLTEAFQAYVLKQDVSFVTPLHTFLALLLFMLLVFRNNASYDRWWEARKVWGGILTTSRCLESFWGSMNKPDEKNKRKCSHLLSQSLKELSAPDSSVSRSLICQLLTSLRDWLDAGLILVNDFQTMERHCAQLIDLMGSCDRLRSTPLPMNATSLVRQLMIAYVIAIPWGIPQSWENLFVVSIFAYFLFAVEASASYMQAPFGSGPDQHDLAQLHLLLLPESVVGKSQADA